MSSDRPGTPRTVEASEFEAGCLRLVDEVAETGEEIVITRNGRPAARLAPYADQPRSFLSDDSERFPFLREVSHALDRGEAADLEWEAELGLESAHVQGWLGEVNWRRRTAQLHRAGAHYVRLRFDPSLDDDMLALATRFVDVTGSGRFDSDGSWETVHVDKISGTRPWDEPSDLDELLNDPSPRAFDADPAGATDLTDGEWESFDRAIREGRSR